MPSRPAAAHHDVIIVGGGMGGLNLGALLTAAGKDVLVLEKGPRSALGGRAASGRVGDAMVDNGIKGLILNGAEDEVYARIGKTLPPNTCEWTNAGELLFADRAHGPTPDWQPVDDLILENVHDFLEVYKTAAMDMTYEQIEHLNDISIAQYARDRTDNPKIIEFFDYLGWLFGGTLPNAHDYSAGSFFYSIKSQIDATGEMPRLSYWVKGGSGAIAPGLIESIEERGGTIACERAVSHIVVRDGRAVGVEVEKAGQVRAVPTQLLETEFLSADVVVSAVAIWDLFTVLSEDDLQPWYAQRLRHLHKKTLNLLTLTYQLDDEDAFDDTGIRWVQQGPASGKPWAASTLRQNDRGFEVSFWMQLGWWEKPNLHEIREASHKAALHELFAAFEEDVRILFPDVVAGAEWTLRSFGPATIMEAPGQVGATLPDVAVDGIDGLYLVGERTAAHKVMGVYGSAEAALAVADRILGPTAPTVVVPDPEDAAT